MLQAYCTSFWVNFWHKLQVTAGSTNLTGGCGPNETMGNASRSLFQGPSDRHGEWGAWRRYVAQSAADDQKNVRNHADRSISLMRFEGAGMYIRGWGKERFSWRSISTTKSATEYVAPSPRSLREELADGVRSGGAAGPADGGGEGEFLGADLDAILGVAAVGDAAFAHDGFEAVVGVDLAGGMEVEVLDLGEDLGSDEGVVEGELGAGFQGQQPQVMQRERA